MYSSIANFINSNECLSLISRYIFNLFSFSSKSFFSKVLQPTGRNKRIIDINIIILLIFKVFIICITSKINFYHIYSIIKYYLLFIFLPTSKKLVIFKNKKRDRLPVPRGMGGSSTKLSFLLYLVLRRLYLLLHLL
ncbi:hypothetical protein CTC_02365 [Clostridium tetani E88]|uniref:Uncharacterized protein n=1 Tax=Clostridium tetani (strain Massachusetts / E88) TaxID=212717 RepID=Q891K6_CLOTE|nr:hypothetical protein CTC_02365 [Clostridium tetani E88]